MGSLGASAFGAISGGIGAELSGGNFWEGAVIGGVVAGLNHSLHKINDKYTDSINQNNDNGKPRYDYNGKSYDSKAELYGAILIDQAAEQFGIKDVVALAAGLSGHNVIPTRTKFGGATPRTSLNSIMGRKITLSVSTATAGAFKRLPTLTGGPFTGSKLRVVMVNTIGKFIGRTLGPIGWGILAYDVGKTLYNTQMIYNKIVSGGR